MRFPQPEITFGQVNFEFNLPEGQVDLKVDFNPCCLHGLHRPLKHALIKR